MTDLLNHMPDEVTALHRMAKKLIDQDIDEGSVKAMLMKEGLSEMYAAIIIDNVLNDIRDKKDFYKMLIMSVCITGGALWLNYMSYDLALVNNSATMIIFWGLVVSGILMMVKSVAMYRQLPAYIKKKS